jgi:hypothetical protein
LKKKTKFSNDFKYPYRIIFKAPRQEVTTYQSSTSAHPQPAAYNACPLERNEKGGMQDDGVGQHDSL